MPFFLIMQANYISYEVGLYSESYCIEKIIDDKKYASRDLIPSIKAILEKNNIDLSSLAAIGLNQGPAPFTSLRTIVTTANGLAFATGMPLIGINSLEALLTEYKNMQWPVSIALLNAFNNDLYYGIETIDGLTIGCENNVQLFERLLQQFPQDPLLFIGNGALMYKEKLLELFGARGHFLDPLPEGCSLEQLACMTIKTYSNKEKMHKQLSPIYLKDILYTQQI